MPTISVFFGIKIQMYPDDHNPPHFHAKYGEFKASYEIETLQIIKGRMSPKANALIVEWAELHRDELYADWELGAVNRKMSKIDPLE